MIRGLLAGMWLMAVSMSLSAEIVAWKVPLTRFAIQGMESEGMARLKAPPEPSPFFGAGDELWDLMGIPKAAPDREQGLPDVPPPRLETDPPLEWAVWNATTSTLVTKSDWNGIWQLHNRMDVLDQPKQCRVVIDVLEVPKDGSDLSGKSIPVSSLSCVVRSGQVAEVETRSGGKRMWAKLEPAIDEDADLLGLNLEFSCANPSQSSLDLTTQFALVPGQPVWMARDFDGIRGLDVKVTGLIELVDGTQYLDMIRVQDGTGWKNIQSQMTKPKRFRIGEDSWVFIGTAPPDFLPESNGSNGVDIDPFAVPPSPRVQPTVKYPEIPVPDVLRPWINERVLDMRGILKSAGIEVNEGDFAGFGPLSSAFYFYSKSEQELDKCEALLMSGCHLTPNLVAATFNGAGAIRLVSQTGRKSALVRSVDGKEIKRIEIEPTLGDAGDVDLHYFIHDQPSDGKLLHLNSSATLHGGKWLEILGGKDEESGKLRAKVEVTHLE